MPVQIPPGLGKPVTTRSFSLLEMVSRAWGSEFKAPDHGIYVFGGGAIRKDSTDMTTNGFYNNTTINFVTDASGNELNDSSGGMIWGIP